jgi:hypothetical protein
LKEVQNKKALKRREERKKRRSRGKRSRRAKKRKEQERLPSSKGEEKEERENFIYAVLHTKWFFSVSLKLGLRGPKYFVRQLIYLF